MKLERGELPEGVRPVYQRGPGGDCLRACVATVLGLSYEDMGGAPDDISDLQAVRLSEDLFGSGALSPKHWRVVGGAWAKWLEARGVGMIEHKFDKDNPPPVHLKLWIGEVARPDSSGTGVDETAPHTHAVVMSYNAFAHDPNPNQTIDRLGGGFPLIGGSTLWRL